jgi:hypothetical protein
MKTCSHVSSPEWLGIFLLSFRKEVGYATEVVQLI